MTRVTSFSLGAHFTNSVETEVKKGRYINATEIMRAALRLLEEREARTDALRAALLEGEECGPSTSFDFQASITCGGTRKPTCV
jgi:antitoxin ParD1/3/4